MLLETPICDEYFISFALKFRKHWSMWIDRPGESFIFVWRPPGTDFNFRRHRNYLNESNSTHIFLTCIFKSITLDSNKILHCTKILNSLLPKQSQKHKAERPLPSQLSSPRNIANASWWPIHMNLLRMSRNCSVSSLLRTSFSLTRHLYNKIIWIKVVWNYFFHLIS